MWLKWDGVVDCHAHVFERGLPLAAKPRYVPDYDATIAQYIDRLDGIGVAGGVLVQPSFLGTDNSLLLRCLEEYPDRFRGVVVIGPAQQIDLSRMAGSGVVGVRLNLVGQPVPDLSEPRWRRFADQLAELSWHLEIQAHSSQWSALAPMLRGWPSTVVIDHLGLPGASAEADRLVVDLARRDHVWVKASAPYRAAAPGAAEEMLRRISQVTGDERIVWGSDWPWTRHEAGRSYSDCLRWLQGHLAEESLHTVLVVNPARLLGWSPWTASRG